MGDSDTHRKHFLRLAQYNTWFNGQLYALVAELEEADRTRDVGAFFGSIHGTLDHVLLGDRMWLGRFQRSELAFPSLDDAELIHQIESLDQGVEPEFDALCAARQATDATIEAFVRELDAELLAANLAYRNSKGHPFQAPVWLAVGHLFNHQTHHRGQVTALLHQLGHDPGMTDFIVTSVMPEPAG